MSTNRDPFDARHAQVFLEGAYRAPLSERVKTSINPATLEQLGRYPLCAEADIERAVAMAQCAQREWKRTDTQTRAGLLHAVAQAIENSPLRAELAQLLCREMGKPYPDAAGEISLCASVFRYYAEMARDDGGKVAGTNQTGSFQYMRYEPYGVSVHILPFNYPFLLMCWTVAASLAAGNACIIKPAEATSLATLRFMAYFEALPPGLISCLPGDGQTAQGLIASPGTHAVAFTGSVAAARAVGAACAERMKPCVLEAGGSDPMIISRHAPIEIAAAGCVNSAFLLSGQVCTSSERFFVVDEVHEAFVAEFARRTRQLRVGDGMGMAEIGPLVSQAARDKVARLVAEAVSQGARVVCGGRIPPDWPNGWFYEPTILTDVTPQMAIMREECFGPVAAICRVADFDEALRLANDSEFGLGASVFTTDLAEAMEAADRLESGMVWINNPLIDNDALPFSGAKMSGLGCELGRFGLDAFRRTKMVVLDHQPRIHDWWLPRPDEAFFPAQQG
ncbi:aldehyde dehydrogenase family protein [Roseateles koreensis]|uniref:Aldehyde dehydrogenase family protein n=1 Tax=Roseateles koreensis TaxID=2987526 RepID=A0ABT5KVH2_9BURK|nr:aldehyde dehydrogenase family protein [Roseateles koreensis]MDC8785826.1 aldehyde dehydrogenase family protein [Roseateles koreensis]